ncbi:hypothetical protein MPY17_08080 [Rhodococcus opacus]|uniref:hypothetical protein n=1 Tax=Rhodococcus opacus TaxID=37919 RepID=UPI001FF5D42B|nr:hypothetical protein [Rhodococcus opacus]UOT05691.1 hypothetical protein MPY17_08080 [Rhodococcus opacus]
MTDNPYQGTHRLNIHMSRGNRSGVRSGKGSNAATPPCEDQLILDLAIEWLPFNGPSSEDIWLQFGIERTQFWERISCLLAYRQWAWLLDVPTVRALSEQSTATLRAAQRSTTRHYPQ